MKHKLLLSRKIISIIAVLFFSTQLFAQTLNPNFKDGAIYFKFKDDYKNPFRVNKDLSVNPNQFSFLQKVFSQYGLIKLERNLYLFNDPKLLKTLYMEFSNASQIDQLIKELSSLPMIEYAEKVVIPKLFWVPNDPYYVSPYSGQNFRWHLDMIKASQAWDIQQGGVSTVKVAVVDNAIWGAHPDLGISTTNQYNAGTSTAGNSAPPTTVAQNPSCTSTNLQTANGCPAYDWSHGTHCAGLVGAINNNGVGIASIGGGVSVMGVRIADNNGSLAYSYQGVQWAASNGAKVISMSFGGTTFSQTFQNLMTTCFDNNITLVAAAGNEGDAGNAINYPAGYTNVISVASVNSDKKLSSFSQYGSWITVAAPGGFTVSNGTEYLPNILSTTYCTSQLFRVIGLTAFDGKYYDGMNGTSMATPIVAGLCGLMLSKNPNLTPTQIKNCLQSTHQDLAAGSNTISTAGGIIDAQAAMNCVLGTLNNPPVAKFTGAPKVNVYGTTTGTSPNFVYHVKETVNVLQGNNVTYTDQSTINPTSWAWNLPGAVTTNPTTQNPTIAYNTVGTYNAGLTATNAYGNSTLTKNQYVNVLNPSNENCVMLSNHVGSMTYYGAGGTNGYVSGNNSYGDKAKAEFFAANAPFTKLKSVYLGFAVAKNATSPTITVNALANSSGQPGSVIGTATVPLATIVTNTNSGQATNVVFSPSITVSGGFFISVNLPTAAGDTLVLITNADGDTTGCTAWDKGSDNTWTSYETSWGVALNHVIYAEVCTEPVVQAPVANFSASTTSPCTGQTVVYTNTSTGSPTSYTWNFGSNATPATATGAGPHSVTYSLVGAKTVSLTVTNTAGTDSEIKTDYITVKTTPSVSITGDNSICNGEQTTLTGNGATSYSWSNSTSLTTITVNPTSNTTYTVTGTTNGCSAVATSTVTVTNAPNVTITGDNNICNGEQTTLTGNGATSYSWSNSALTPTITVTPTSNATYTVTGTLNGCSATATSTVTVTNVPNVTITGDNNICNGEQTTLTGNGATSYSWSNSTSLTTITVNPTSNATYTVTGTTNGCSATASVTVTVNENPTVTVSTTNETAQAAADGTATATAIGGAPTYSYLWSNNATTNPAEGLVGGVYYVTVTDQNGCKAIGNGTVYTNGQPPVISVTTPTVSCGIPATVTYNVNSTGGAITSYAWTFQGGNPATSNLPSPTVTYAAAGSFGFTLTVTNVNGTDDANGTIVILENIQLTMSSTDEIGTGAANGSATATVTSGGAAPYTFNWSNGGSTGTISGLSTGNYNVTVSDQNGCSATGTVFVDFGTSIETADALSYSIFPNPSNGKLNIESNKSIESVAVYDILGKAIATYQLNNTKNVIDLSRFENGLYILKIQINNEYRIQRIVLDK